MRDHDWYADGYNEFRAECRSCGQVIELNGGIVKNCDDAVMERRRRPPPERAYNIGYAVPRPAWDLSTPAHPLGEIQFQNESPAARSTAEAQPPMQNRIRELAREHELASRMESGAAIRLREREPQTEQEVRQYMNVISDEDVNF